MLEFKLSHGWMVAKVLLTKIKDISWSPGKKMPLVGVTKYTE